MTIAEIRTKDNIDICIHGHSGYAEHGSDIICAGVSALSQAFCMQVENAKINTDDGFISVAAEMTTRNKVRLDMLVSGLKAISEEYPQYLEIFLQE